MNEFRHPIYFVLKNHSRDVKLTRITYSTDCQRVEYTPSPFEWPNTQFSYSFRKSINIGGHNFFLFLLRLKYHENNNKVGFEFDSMKSILRRLDD